MTESFELTDEDRRRIGRQIAHEEVRNLLLVGVALVVIGGIGCWFARWETSTFDQYWTVDDRTIALQIACLGEARTTVWEHPDRVEIRLDQRPPASNCDALYHQCVVMREPLADRMVIDERTGRSAVGFSDFGDTQCSPEYTS